MAKKLVVIGGGVAGLSAGIYGAANGFDTEVLEMHSIPGGLCTAWQRKGFTIDGCVHWLVGSKPGTYMNSVWRDLGLSPEQRFVDHNEYATVVFGDGRRTVLDVDADIMERKLTDQFPEDRETIEEFCGLVRRFRGFADGFGADDCVMRKLKALYQMVRTMPWLMRYMKLSCSDFAKRVKNPDLAMLFSYFFHPDIPFLFMVLTFGWLWDRNSGYPLGGSLVLANMMKTRFEELGGKLTLNTRVDRIVRKDGKVTGVVTSDGREIPADWVVSAADLHTTLEKLLDPPSGDAVFSRLFAETKPFEPLLLAAYSIPADSLGIPGGVAGACLVTEGEWKQEGLDTLMIQVHPFSHDPTLSPAGKTVALVIIQANYDYWTRLAADPAAYRARKAEIGQQLPGVIDHYLPGFSSHAELLDVATPKTFERYTGNFRGSFEGWIPTTQNFRRTVPVTVADADRLVLAGQWVRIGGGLPPSALSGMDAVRHICKVEGRRFRRPNGRVAR